jgi:N-acetylglucosaminyldiphosphoundecaprenol N-acetyl-beta-D-mannosaminyltransferase
MTILGVKVDQITKTAAIAKIADFLAQNVQFFITTPNPEIILYAHKHPDYREILNKADLAIPDGAGLVLVSKIIGKPLFARISGADMVPEIAKLAREKKLKIALLGGLNQSMIEKTTEIMRGWGNEVVYASHGVPKEHWNNPSFHEKIIDGINASGTHIVFAGFGHPKQEEWINKYRDRLPTVKLFVGVGGALEFVAGAIKRAPHWMQKIGLEWLWRLIQEPRRAKRIFNAVIVFPFTAVYGQFRKK